jgi:exopolyphosphatase/guanosine-5'-triphosphate,3'-diphosphate pyrophosphatase
VGTNSVKLLVADVGGTQVRPVLEESHQTRLGQGFYETHELRAEAVEATAEAVCEFVSKARENGAVAIRIFATSAAREARNPEVLSSAIQRSTGIDLEIVSGEQEAAWAFRGVTTDPALRVGPVLLADVGASRWARCACWSGSPTRTRLNRSS